MAARRAVRCRHLLPSKKPFDHVKLAVVIVTDEHRIVPSRPSSFVHDLAHPVVDHFRISRTVGRPDVARPSELAVIDVTEVVVSIWAVVGKVRSVRIAELYSASEFGALRVVDDRVVDPYLHTLAGELPSVGMMRPNLLQHVGLVGRETVRAKVKCRVRRCLRRRHGLWRCLRRRRGFRRGPCRRGAIATAAASSKKQNATCDRDRRCKEIGVHLEFASTS